MKGHMKKQTKKKRKKGTRKKAQTASLSNGVLNSDNESVSAEQEIKTKFYQGLQKKEPERKTRDNKGSSVNYFQMAGQFLRECKVELKKVKWPTRKELLASTTVVIVLALLVSLFLGLIDVGLIRIIRSIVG